VLARARLCLATEALLEHDGGARYDGAQPGQFVALLGQEDGVGAEVSSGDPQLLHGMHRV